MSLVWPILAHLSAEPLVGLKRCDSSFLPVRYSPFSRTPRGFEADDTRRVEIPVVLSAEPLVGLKHDESGVRISRFDTFSRTPRGFEAW